MEEELKVDLIVLSSFTQNPKIISSATLKLTWFFLLANNLIFLKQKLRQN